MEPSVQAAIVTGISTVSVGLCAPFLAWYFSMRHARREANTRRMAVIELATKRTQFWNQLIETQLKLSDADSHERLEIKDIAASALRQIHLDANLEMAELSWADQIRRSLGGKPHNLQVSRCRTRGEKFGIKLTLWLSRICWSFCFLLFGLSVCYIWLTRGSESMRQLVFITITAMTGCGAAGFFSWWAVTLRRGAEELKYPKPDGPLLDHI